LSLLDTHYVRKENQLFPYLEKHGVTGPSQVMWGIHDEIRGMLKKISAAVDSMDISVLSETGPALSRAVIEMIYKENSILFPMAVDTLSDKEWLEIRKGEDEVGYAFVKPGGEWPEERSAGEPVAHEEKPENLLKLDTGALTVDQVNLLLKHLPVEVSFVDENNVVRYYSDTKDRIFPRSPGVIGRTVQNCHPPKSVHIVNRILESFRSGEKDYADFWIRMHGRMILIRYFAVRDSESTYKGTIEVTQDITDIKSLEGEQRLLDWDDAN